MKAKELFPITEKRIQRRLLTRLFAVLVFLALLWHEPSLSSTSPNKTPHWTALARHVGQNEKSREAALTELLKIPNLDQSLLKSLDSYNRPLSLDVISALQKQNLVPALLEKVIQDEDGFLTLTLNSLLREENKIQITGEYLALLAASSGQKLSAPAIVAMLEPLGRLNITIPHKTLSILFKNEYPEVRSSALYYVRKMILNSRSGEYANFVKESLGLSPYQLRIQTLFLIEEVAASKNINTLIKSSDLQKNCDKEQHGFVKKQCQLLAKKLKEAGK